MAPTQNGRKLTEHLRSWQCREQSREGVPLTDNGTPFTSSVVQYWLKSSGCRHVFTAPRHPESNGLAENFVKTLKNAVEAMILAPFQNLEQCIDSFLLQYWNAKHATTVESPSKLFKNRALRTSMHNVSSADVTIFKGTSQKRSCGVIMQNLGNRMVTII